MIETAVITPAAQGSGARITAVFRLLRLPDLGASVYVAEETGAQSFFSL